MCLFCNELSADHLFFDCEVAKQLWVTLSKVFDMKLGSSDSIGNFKLSNIKGMEF